MPYRLKGRTEERAAGVAPTRPTVESTRVGARPEATTGGGAVARARADPPRRFLVVLGVGILLYAVAANALADTGNPLYVPSLLLLGSAIVPATFATAAGRDAARAAVTVPALVAAAVVG